MLNECMHVTHHSVRVVDCRHSMVGGCSGDVTYTCRFLHYTLFIRYNNVCLSAALHGDENPLKSLLHTFNRKKVLLWLWLYDLYLCPVRPGPVAT